MTDARSVFISYAHRDKDRVVPIASSLGRLGLHVWMDVKALAGGAAIVEEVSEAIARSDLYVVALSPAAIGSSWVHHELNTALALEIARGGPKVLPVIVAEVEVPAALRGRFYVDLSGPSAGRRNSLKDAVRRQLPGLAAAVRARRAAGPPLLSRANPEAEIALSLFQRHELIDLHIHRIEDGLTRQFGWGRQRARTALFVVYELMANALEHGCEGCGDRRATLRLRLTGDGARLVVDVEDEGPGFSLAEALRRAEALSDEAERGRGLSIISRIAPDLTANAAGRVQATIVRDVREISAVRADRGSPSVDAPPGPASPRPGPEPPSIPIGHYRHYDIDMEGPACVARIIPSKLLDDWVCQEVREQGLDLIGRCRILVLDISNVEYIASHFWGFFTAMKRKASGLNGYFCIAAPCREILEIFIVTRLDRVFAVYGTVPEALDAIGRMC